jgi:hypothetical protein
MDLLVPGALIDREMVQFPQTGEGVSLRSREAASKASVQNIGITRRVSVRLSVKRQAEQTSNTEPVCLSVRDPKRRKWSVRHQHLVLLEVVVQPSIQHVPCYR